ncbi:ATP-binding protein [Duganella sp. PWIR1]
MDLHFGDTWQLIHLPLHAAVEMGGTVVALMVAYVLLRLDAVDEGSSFNHILAAALTGMAVLDGLHALMPPGLVFFWLRSVATAFGGLLFALVWLGSWPPRLLRCWPAIALAVGAAIGGASLLWSEYLPAMLAQRQFTPAAFMLNLCGGVLLLAAALKLQLSYRRSRKAADLLFSLQCMFLGVGGLFFHISAPWDLLWWALHLVRLAGYCVALWLVATATNRLETRILALNNTLERQVAERTAELQQSMDALKGAQEELLQSEKMASLGSMVAGISHELNTPLGTALTLASTQQDRAAQFKQLIDSGNLKKSALTDFVDRNSEVANLILKCIERASELIVSFKQVAIDQSSERRREFALHELLEDVLATIRPTIKRAPVSIELEVEHGLHCDTFPGPLTQVICNLIQNAVLHAFEGKESGVIRLQGRRHGEADIELVIADDGTGMDSVVLARIFDPFFTTRLGQGGSGIGLAVCRRIAGSVLGGTLVVASEPGSGSRFTLIFPAMATGKL